MDQQNRQQALRAYFPNIYTVISTIHKMEPSAQETNFETVFRKCPPQNKWKGIVEKRRKSLTAEGLKKF